MSSVYVIEVLCNQVYEICTTQKVAKSQIFSIWSYLPKSECNSIIHNDKKWTNTANSKSDKSHGTYVFFVIFGNLDKAVL